MGLPNGVNAYYRTIFVEDARGNPNFPAARTRLPLYRADALPGYPVPAWLVLRVIYIPCYMFGIPYVRSLVWGGSLACLIYMAVQLL